MAENSLSRIAEHVLEELEALVGCPAEGVTAIRREEQSNGQAPHWVVTAEILELERVPETSDVLATYEVTVDDDGQLTGYRRTGRYTRASVDHP
jgi:Gas vesicle synthesis protein GvpO